MLLSSPPSSLKELYLLEAPEQNWEKAHRYWGVELVPREKIWVWAHNVVLPLYRDLNTHLPLYLVVLRLCERVRWEQVTLMAVNSWDKTLWMVIRRSVGNRDKQLTSIAPATRNHPDNTEQSRKTLVYQGIEDRSEEFIRSVSVDCSIGCSILVDTRW